jgi:hypothetical protein
VTSNFMSSFPVISTSFDEVLREQPKTAQTSAIRNTKRVFRHPRFFRSKPYRAM